MALLGMAVVFFFLLLLILFMRLSNFFLSAGSARELEEIEAAERRKAKSLHPRIEDPLLVAVIGAAVATHRAQTLRSGSS